LYIAPEHRGHGVGRALIDAAVTEVQKRNARCLWLETQNINYAAIQFYKRVGFQWCGLDTSLYDPQRVATEEIALFFVRWLL
jgi:ribosomal protein S18 acetylase RimI-like enzyme